jgi:DNA-directed RNA polymerase specialized sigma24 family protein
MQEQDDDSVSQWIAGVKSSDERAARCLYERYLQRLTALARTRLNGSRRRIVDEEDVAHAVLANFFDCAKRGAFARLENRADLWQVLTMITERRVSDFKRRQFRQKRGEGRELGESAIGRDEVRNCKIRSMEQVLDSEASAEWVLQCIERCLDLFARLGDPLLEQIFLLKLAGYDHAEIARELGCVRRTVQRKLLVIREFWEAGEERGP